MDEYSREYLWRGRAGAPFRPGSGRASDRPGARRRGRASRRRRPGRPRGYGESYGLERGARYGLEYTAEYAPRRRPESGRPYAAEYREFAARVRLPGKPARGYPVRGIHSYDLDYGDLAGPTTDYSGRAGYAEDRAWDETPRGTYTPRLAEIGREARLRRRLYGDLGPTYSGPGRRGRGWR